MELGSVFWPVWLQILLFPLCERARMLSGFSHIWLFAALWTLARQAPLSIGFSRQEYWSGLPCPPPGDLAHPAIEPASTWIGRQIVYHWTTWEALLRKLQCGKDIWGFLVYPSSSNKSEMLSQRALKSHSGLHWRSLEGTWRELQSTFFLLILGSK